MKIYHYYNTYTIAYLKRAVLKINILFIIILACLISPIYSQSPSFKTNSILREGETYKLGIVEDGVFTINYSFLKDTLGIDPASINPKNISIYGNAGSPLPELINEYRVDDLEPTSIYIQGEEDGRFDIDDEIIFYAVGPDHLDYDNGTINLHKNPYATLNYYYLRIENIQGERVEIKEGPVNTNYQSTHTDAILRHETELVNLLADFGSTQGSGQKWYGEELTDLSEIDLSSKFDLEDIDLSEPINLNMEFVGRSGATSNVILNIDDRRFSKSINSVRISDVEAIYAKPASIEETLELRNTNPEIVLQYPETSAGNSGWLDYLQIVYRKKLIYGNEPITFFDRRSVDEASASFEIANSKEGLFVWNVSNIHQIKNQLFRVNNGNVNFNYEPDNNLQKFILFDPSNISAAPKYINKLTPQNLHAINDADMLIIYHQEFKDAAEKLQNHRRSHSNLEVKIVDIDQVYNEFSSGKQDPTAIRDFAKMLYDRDENFKYLLLLGDGSYDFRWINTKFSNQSFIPAYETKESLNPLTAFPTDDYYALLSNGEGGTLRGAIDIAVGRIPAKTNQEANNVVDKIIRYDTAPETTGDWKNRIAFTADDEDSNIHLNQAEQIAKSVKQKHPNFNQEKIYFDAFKQVSTPGGARYPDAEDKLNNEIFKGLLILNYLGHGGPKGWSQERVLKTTEIGSWTNKNKLPLIITATCSFTGFDDPALVTGGEEAILNKDGGAIALFSTVRSVYSSQNFRLTKSVFDTIFSPNTSEQLAIGEILRRAKNSNSADTININARKFLLIGDPSLKLALPTYDIVATHVNNSTIDISRIDTIKALQKVQIAGKIIDQNGDLVTSYNGKLFPTLYDKEASLETLSNDTGSPKKSFEVRRNILYSGTATVTNGTFDFEFVLPKDINYTYGPGKLSFYATESNRSEASGFYDKIIIGGTDDSIADDDSGPAIQLYMNDEQFVSGGITNQDPELLIKLFDDNGINFSGTSIGHDITAILDDNTQNTFILNDFYKSEQDNFKQGMVRYPLKDISPGLHTLKVKAFDVVNNVGEAIIEFYVLEDGELQLQNVLNYPNPFSTSTNFMFEHNLPNTTLSSIINIYTVSGKLIKSIVSDFVSSGFRNSDISWDGRDDFGNQLGRGIYLYQIKLNASELGITINSDFKKLLLIR